MGQSFSLRGPEFQRRAKYILNCEVTMNQKEISELKRRFRLGKNAIGRIYGCYVNSPKGSAPPRP